VRALNRTVRGWAGYFSYGSVSKARHTVDLHVYHSVRAFLRRRHKVAGFGYRQFPAQRVFGELVWCRSTRPIVGARRIPPCETRPRAG
jgi:RNA-directed DNA polymerase